MGNWLLVIALHLLIAQYPTYHTLEPREDNQEDTSICRTAVSAE